MIYRFRVNERIRVKEARVIGAKGEQLGTLPVSEGLRLAREAGLDLVEVASQAKPPVCRIMDYSKYKYEQEKKERQAHKKQKVVHIKEIKFKPRIEEHDYQTKLNHLRKFIQKGDKAKITMTFRGREMAHIEIGRAILDRLSGDISDIAELEKEPLLEGRRMVMVLSPK